MNRYWSWALSGVALAACFLLAVILVKPIGVSTQFVIADGIIWSLFDDNLIQSGADSKTGYSSTNAYLDKSGGKYAKAVDNPVNYSFFFVLAMIFGAFLGRVMSKKETEESPGLFYSRLNISPAARWIMAFMGGVLVLYGARLAGGCTSGHMMSGMMQTSLSGYLFAAGAFAAAVPVAILIHGRGKE